MTNHRTKAATILGALLLIASPAIAQPSQLLTAEFSDLEEREDPFTAILGASQRYTLQADLEDAGDVSILRTGLNLTLAYQLDAHAQIAVNLGYEYSHYNFGSVPAAQDVLDDAYSLAISPIFTQRIDENWGWFLGAQGKVSAAEGAELGESILGGVLAGASYRFNENLTLTLGVAVQTRIEDDARVIPLPGILWNVSDRVRLYTQGPGLTLEADATDEWTLRMKGRWEPREYRLDDEFAAAPDGVLQDERVLVSAEAVWSPQPRLELRLELGGVLYQEYELLDDAGNDVSDFETDPALFLAIGGSYRF